MGKKRRINRFINKWIKSDLPEDRCSSVLLLGVTRIPTSPTPTHRPCSLPLPNPIVKPAQERRTSFCGSALRRLKPNEKCDNNITKASLQVHVKNSIDKSNAVDDKNLMEKSVDSIGTCSLDVEASADLSDWSEISSTGTLHSVVVTTPSPADKHLPSYLSLACTVNGYSNTTNYNPTRLSKSRDASPLRFGQDNNLTPKSTSSGHLLQNNLLSPSNLVPLPSQVKAISITTSKMSEDMASLSQHHDFYKTSSQTMTAYISKETYNSSSCSSNNIYAKDSVDGCYENGISKKFSTTRTSLSKHQEYRNGTETKSFIEQRVERLYGPGALAQGFFVSKKDKTENENSDSKKTPAMDSNLMKQSTSSPTLPVLRHLRPEFRAQLPVAVKARKNTEMQKSSTVPTLKEQVNGQSQQQEANEKMVIQVHSEKIVEKNGEYFLKILARETERLLTLADNCESDLSNTELSEEIVGKIRSASGKARLLVSQKMQQFKGLCTNNMTQVAGEAFPTTNEDLQGFWDMVMLQVDQVDALFDEMKTLKSNNWIEKKITKKETNGIKAKKTVVNSPKHQTTTTTTTQGTTANQEARKQQQILRKQIIEARRKALREQNKGHETIEIFAPETS